MSGTIGENIRKALEQIPGRVSFFYRNLEDGGTLRWQDTLPQPAASLIKIPILIAACAAMREGTLAGDECFRLKSSDMAPSCGCLNRMHPGLEVTAEDLCNLMIILSDNTAANMLIRRLGMDAVSRRMAALGYRVTRVNRLLCDAEAPRSGRENFTTAAETADMLEKIWRGQMIGEAESAFMLDILTEQRLNGGIPFFFGEKTRIAHKTGEGEGIAHDAGIVLGEHPFLACFMASGTDAPRFERFIQDMAYALRRGIGAERS